MRATTSSPRVTPTVSSSSSTRSNPTDSPVVAGIADAAAVGRIDAGLRLPATALAADPDENLDLLIELVDLDRAVWTPTVEERAATSGDDDAGILLARKAADDLGVEVGDTDRAASPDPDRRGWLLDRRDAARRLRHPRQPDPHVRLPRHRRRRAASASRVS